VAQICLQLAWNPTDVEGFLARARMADEAGAHSVWVNEGFGHDAFSGLALLARETGRVRLGTSIVNVFSRTPGALAQHFATIDQLSGGRVLVGLGVSSAGVAGRFHGVPFERPMARLRETVELLRLYWRKERFSYQGRVFSIDRALAMGVDPVQLEPPVFLATLAPRSVALTARIADGWLPAWIPHDRLGPEIAHLREGVRAAGRDPAAFTVRSPGTTVVVLDERAAAQVREARRRTLAFFVARNGEFYFNQFRRHGLAAEAEAIRAAWDGGGPEAAYAATPPEMAGRFDFVGDVDACMAHIARQSALGVDLHTVTTAGGPSGEAAEAIATLAKTPLPA
jgi:alkanesulfonate monooxygenase SsuD/methylene tetrahydromethanopterin reductase-like flavin-dependent oxidoreductase (luciferase family)